MKSLLELMALLASAAIGGVIPWIVAAMASVGQGGLEGGRGAGNYVLAIYATLPCALVGVLIGGYLFAQARKRP